MTTESKPEIRRARTPAEWSTIRDHYVQGVEDNQGRLNYPTLEELASNSGVAITTLRRRATTEKWREQRTGFARTVTKVRDEKKSAALAAKGADFDLACLKLAHDMLEEITNRLGTPDLSPTNVKSLTSALADAQKVGRLALGEPPENPNDTNPTFQVNVVCNDE